MDGIIKSLNKQLGPRIVVRAAHIVDYDFDARHSALARIYRYTILSAPSPDPFRAAFSWHISQPLDVEAMRVASAAIEGEHDFTSFCRQPPDGRHLIRRIFQAEWLLPEPGIVRFDVEAKAFCHQMVRSLVGTLVSIGLGRLQPTEMAAILVARDRHPAGTPAPPQGLCLWAVKYPDGL